MANPENPPVILVGNQAVKAASLVGRGIPCFIFPTQKQAEQWRSTLNAIEAVGEQKLRRSNYEDVLEAIEAREKKLSELSGLLVDVLQSNPVDGVRERLVNGLQYP
ncbi:hypothetical protein [Rhodoferax sp. GW822-FHT02A01]|uniref:hypothetical protein n=1 Tax=Rhodoferax sp. GW822-FHT02A01 TaxID=3141537 RepID=UPI00315CCAD2